MTLALTIGVLIAGAVYLILQRGMVRVVLGFVLLSHGANLLLMSAGGVFQRGAPLLGQGSVADMADPLPQAFVLTAIVIAFSITIYMLTLAATGEGDDTEDAS
ncbi:MULTISPECIES: cation:proton antiporter subunit C [unclassified Nocardiopsis]|uniref:sodium:proton antiporter n=1 Tax=unclassified Nocardiopsis TaxID=2649073 RepID=UPI00340EB993